ncbi:hypothetical protein RhiJN_28905 [Ceratobasidium sp. AG-Ba]|nr:hypothetical protein RhiJN_28905 [Ceratobasidium sp. AG-Ba]
MSEFTTPTKSSESAAGGSPSIVSRKVGAGIQARLAKLQGATGAQVVNREMPKKFASGYDEPFRERLDGTLRRSLSGTWSVNALEAENTSASVSTDGSQTLVDVQPSSLPTVSEEAELKRRRDFTKRWEQQQEAVVERLLTPEPSRIQSSPQPIIEEPEPEELEVKIPESQPIPITPIQAPPPEDSKHGILTPPISEPESTPVRKAPTKPTVRPHTTGPATRVRTRPVPQATSPTPTIAPKTPTRSRPRASAPTLAPPPVPRLHLTPSPSRTTPRTPSVPPRSQTSMSSRRVSAPARTRLSSNIPDKVVPPPVRPRTISKVYEGPTISSLAKQKPLVSLGSPSRAVSRADFSPA